MRKLSFKIILCLLALAAAFGASGCDKGSDAESTPSAAVETAEVPAAQQKQENGEHRDYAEETAKCKESGSIVIAELSDGKRGMEFYTNPVNEGYLEFYANELNELKVTLGKDVRVYSMIVPTACELYCPKNERGSIDSQEQVIKDVKDMLMDVEQVDVLPILQNHNAENIYFRTDSRWTPLGAYYAGRVFANAAGVPYAGLADYTQTDPRDYVGDFRLMCDPEGLEELEKQPDKFVFYYPNAGYITNYYDSQFEFLSDDKYFDIIPDNLYDSFYKGGYYCLRIDTRARGDRKLIIVKDEYGTALPTFLTSSFSQIYVVSYNYLEANLVEMIEDFGITDVLYLMNTYTVTDSRVYKLETLRSQATHGTLSDAAPVKEVDEEGVKPGSDKDSSSDSDESSDSDTDNVEYIYGVGVNNVVGIVENSDEDNAESSGYVPDETQGDDEGYGYDDNVDEGYDEAYDDGEEMNNEW